MRVASAPRHFHERGNIPLHDRSRALALTLPPALLCRALCDEATLGPLVLNSQALGLATREGDQPADESCAVGYDRGSQRYRL